MDIGTFISLRKMLESDGISLTQTHGTDGRTVPLFEEQGKTDERQTGPEAGRAAPVTHPRPLQRLGPEESDALPASRGWASVYPSPIAGFLAQPSSAPRP